MRKYKVQLLSPFFALVSLALIGCGSFPEQVKVGDPKLKPFSSMYKVNRNKLGFTPIPAQADIQQNKRNPSAAWSGFWR